MYTGQALKYINRDDYSINFAKISSDSNELPDVDSYQYSKSTVLARGGVNGFFVVVSNSSFVHSQVYDKSGNLISMTSLSTFQQVNATFRLSKDQMNAYASGKFGFSCAIRDSLSTGWNNYTTKIKLVQVNSANGRVVCQANQVSLYRIQTWGTYSDTGALWPDQSNNYDDGSGGIIDTTGDNSTTGGGGGDGGNTNTNNTNTNNSTNSSTGTNTTTGNNTNTSTGSNNTNSSTGTNTTNNNTGGGG